ncbi:Helicase, SNF2/RAD54 family [Clostridium bornimense]|uniref:Helicase, SNF2/RAD54 family n=1 Tax=Clostridium bornimense TaxID=1216932 RepID=W6S2F9_9CLOT|nr:DEAD/DEAH box helicase [Clostridium bornimense]CDM68487.1 Helicase, SNF2/RAD54 family [Clostridium bornimense]
MNDIKIGNIRKKAILENINKGYYFYKRDHVFDFWEREVDEFSRRLSCYVASENFDEYLINFVVDKGDNLLEGQCTCPYKVKTNDNCKHVVAAYLYYLNEVAKSKESYENLSVMRKFLNSIKEDEPESIVKFDIIIAEVNKEVRGYFKIGKNKKYVIRQFKNFIFDLENSEEIVFGKEFTWKKNHHGFNPTDRRIIKILHQYIEDENFNEKTTEGKYFIFNRTIIKDIIELLKYKEFYIEEENRLVKGDIVYDDIALEFICKNINGNLSLTIEKMPISIDESNIYLYDDKLYVTTIDFHELYSEIKSLFGDNNYIIIEDEDKDDFFKYGFSRFNSLGRVTLENTLENIIIDEPLRTEFYFDKEERNVVLTVFFNYKNIRINPFREDYKEAVIRDIKKENRILREIYKLGFIKNDNNLLLKSDKDILNLQINGIEVLKEFGEIYYSEAFKKMEVNSIKVKTMLSLNDDGWLNFSFGVDNYDSIELRNILESIRVNKKFYRAKDGSFLSLESEDIKKLSHVIEVLDINNSDIDKGNVLLNKYHSLYLKDMFINKLDKSIENLLNDVENFNLNDFKLEENVNYKLRYYQIEGVKWLSTLYQYKFGGILADEMGLGKTIQTIAFIQNVIKKGNNQCNLIVCPTSLIFNWVQEINKFAPELKVSCLYGDREKRSNLVESIDSSHIIITSYSILKRDIELLSKINFNLCILDEAQAIKNSSSITWKCAKKINAKCRFALTGTPIENSLIELWAIFDFIMPGFLSNEKKFREQFQIPIMIENDKKLLKELQDKIVPFILRRKKKDVLGELPNKIERKVIVDLNDEQKKIYTSLVNSINEEIDNNSDKSNLGKTKILILSTLTKLRQICCDPSSIIEGYNGGSSKIDILIDILDKSIDDGHKILVFSQFTSILKNVRKILENLDIKSMYLDGEIKAKTRIEMVDEFNKSNIPVFLISLKAGGSGLNLTSADIVIHLDPWWNPAVENQATDRAHRIGQENVVEVIKLISKGTIEEKIYNLQEKKKMLISDVIDGEEMDRSIITSMSLEDIKNIFKI